MPLGRFKAVLFDIDGTLVDTLDALVEGLGDLYERYAGKRPSRGEIKSTIGRALRDTVVMHQKTSLSPEQVSEMYDYTLDRFEANQQLEKPYQSAIEAFRICVDSHLRVGFVTSKCQKEYDMFAKRHLWMLGADTTVTASDVVHPKPAPDSCTLACERLGVSPEDTVMVGDSVYDMQCAHEARVSAVAVSYGAASPTDIERTHPDLTFSTPEQLLEWVKQTILQTEHASKETSHARSS